MNSDAYEQAKCNVESFEVRGNTVRIVEYEKRTDLLVNGQKWRYFQTDDGFTLHRDAYRGPFKTLRGAVESYFDFYESEEREESGR